MRLNYFHYTQIRNPFDYEFLHTSESFLNSEILHTYKVVEEDDKITKIPLT